MTESATQAVRASIGVTILTAFALFASFGVQLVAASAIGASAELDAYYVALTIPTVLVGLVTSTLGAALVPVFARLLTAGDVVAAWSTATRTVAVSLLFLVFLCTIGMLAAQPLLRTTAPGLAPSALQEAADLAIVLWPATALTGFATMLGALHQARRRFLQAASGPLVGNLVTLFAAAAVVGTVGIRGLAFAALIGATAQLTVVGVAAFPSPVQRWFLIRRRIGRVQHVARLWSPLLVGGIAFQSLVIFDRFLASSLTPGSVTYLALAQRLVGVLGTLITSGAVTVGVVTMSGNLATGDLAAFRRTLSRGLSTLFVLVIPVITILAGLRAPFVTVLFERGHFDPGDANALATTFPFYLLALPGITLGSAIGAAYYALQDTRTLTVLGLAGVAVYFLYMPRLAAAFGATGIAAGVGIYYTYQFIGAGVALWLKLGRPSLAGAVARAGRAVVAALGAGVTAAACATFIPIALGQLFLGVFISAGLYISALIFLSPDEPMVRAVRRLFSLRADATSGDDR